ncbi:uncharacterized protein SOCE26_106280 [Sorangium cellulosum]|uniref:Uncharacterized protein n=1 Tax=Sorangium cellulosum TaxID=56 RepID=A0A2L0FC26_SORCE|nr:hypothetical protein [Sorangium cellulosum]AUX49083.1 uncharacterized protein SOCE26_106280 [Sorangium cellulosum]
MGAERRASRQRAIANAASSSTTDAPVGAVCACCANAPPATPTAAGTCTSTTAQYSVGAPQRPPIHHDNGFRQNPSDSDDPTPTPTTEPNLADRASLLYWRGTLEGAEAAQGVPYVPHNDIPDALAAYRHFLDGMGTDRTFSYERFVASDSSGAVILRNAIRDIQLCAEKFYRKMLADDPSLATRRVTFALTGTSIPAGSGSLYPYPSTENWQKAIGAHVIWMSGTVVVEPAPCSGGGEPVLKMRTTLHAEDRYNFNPGAADIATGTPDAANGRFEVTGLAHQYMNYATLQRDVTWMLGRPDAGVTARQDNSRQRQPSDNRRARNRI